MLVCVPRVLDKAQLAPLRGLLDRANDWIDGRSTAGLQAAAAKFNQQIDEQSEVAKTCQRLVAAALERNPVFMSAALPNILYPPVFNRYGEGMKYGPHVDGSVRFHPQLGRKVRIDVSGTLFLTRPSEYEGGELQIEDTFGPRSVKLDAGDLVIYPSTSLHQVMPVTRGIRMACVLWVQSLVHDDAQRALLYEMDSAIQQLNQSDADEIARHRLVACYHNLVRQWSQT
jgi:PKHD-type hydroxylase